MLDKDAGAATGAHVGGIEGLIEPGGEGILGEGDMARDGAEVPGLAAREEGPGPGAEGVSGPALVRIGAEEDGVRGKVAEVALLIGGGGSLVPVIKDSGDGGTRVFGLSGGGGDEGETEQEGERHGRDSRGDGFRV